VAVSTRANQATVNAIKTRVDSLATTNLDASVSSRASHASLDALHGTIDALGLSELGDLLRRAKIEVTLASQERTHACRPLLRPRERGRPPRGRARNRR
jgi:hypothetical protein